MALDDTVHADDRAGTTPVRRLGRQRPANRRELIINAAARAFSAGGYHAVRLDAIAADVGISAPALYRHFPNKYALFAETTRTLAARLSDALDGVTAEAETPSLRALLTALTATAIANRRTGGLYRWEARYLEADDAAAIRDVVIRQHRAVRTALLADRPGLSRTDADLLTGAMISVVASPTTHSATMPTRQIQTLIVDAALSIAGVDLPAEHDETPTPSTGLAPASKRERLVHEATALFAQRGFHDVTVDDIATAAGLPTSGVYRHFPSKTALLEAAFWRAGDRTTSSIADALGSAGTPREAVEALVRRYVRLSMTHPHLLIVYMTELGSVSPDQRSALRNQQRIAVEEWSAWVVRANPGRTPIQARFLVHAALGIILDVVRLDNSVAADRICTVADRLLVDPQNYPAEPVTP